MESLLKQHYQAKEQLELIQTSFEMIRDELKELLSYMKNQGTRRDGCFPAYEYQESMQRLRNIIDSFGE